MVRNLTIYESANPGFRRVSRTSVAGAVGDVTRCAALTFVYLAVVGAALYTVDARGAGVSIAYVAGALSTASWRLWFTRRLPGLSADSGSAAAHGPEVGWVLFMSLFFMLNTPLLQSSFTGMDNYGFHSLPRVSGSITPFALAASFNLLLALTAAILFGLLWNRHYLNASTRTGPFRSAVTVALMPLALIYAPIVFLSTPGGETYFLVVFAILFGAFATVAGFSDPRVRLIEWAAKWSFIATLQLGIAFFIASIVGIVLFYTEIPHEVADHNRVWNWSTDWRALGYLPPEYANRMLTGFLWTAIAGMAYMVTMVGGYLLTTIYQRQIAPSMKKERAVVEETRLTDSAGAADSRNTIRKRLQRLADLEGSVLELRHLQTAYALMETGTPGEAAESLGVTRKTIDNRVHQILERTGLDGQLRNPEQLRGYLLGLR